MLTDIRKSTCVDGVLAGLLRPASLLRLYEPVSWVYSALRRGEALNCVFQGASSKTDQVLVVTDERADIIFFVE